MATDYTTETRETAREQRSVKFIVKLTNFLRLIKFPRLIGKFPKSQVDYQIPKIWRKFPSSGPAPTDIYAGACC